MPRAACAEQIALLCSAVLCAFDTGVTFWSAVRGYFAWGKKQGAVKDQIHVEKEEKKVVPGTQQHVLLYVRKKAHSAARHSTSAKGTRHRTARLRTALRCAAGLYKAGLIWAGRALWSNSVVPDDMYKPGVVVPVCTTSKYKSQGLLVGSNPGVRIPVSSGEKNDSHKKNDTYLNFVKK